MRSHSHTQPTTLWRALVALSVLTLIGGACGSTDDDAQGDGVASLREASNDDAASSAATSDSSGEVLRPGRRTGAREPHRASAP